jgi:hypothetical protein
MQRPGREGSIQKYPTAKPQRWPRALELGIKTAMASKIARGVAQVGMLCPTITKRGLTLYVRMASIPASRKNQTL